MTSLLVSLKMIANKNCDEKSWWDVGYDVFNHVFSYDVRFAFNENRRKGSVVTRRVVGT